MAMGVHNAGAHGRRGTRRAPMAEINVTPFVDVMLVLLIIFMVTAPLLVAGVPIDLPDSRAKPIDQNDTEPVQISVDGSGGVYIGEEEVAPTDVPERFEALAEAQARAGGGAPQILLRGDRDLDYGAVMRVMGELNRVGLNRVSLVTTGSGDAAPRAVTGRSRVTDGSGREP